MGLMRKIQKALMYFFANGVILIILFYTLLHQARLAATLISIYNLASQIGT